MLNSTTRIFCRNSHCRAKLPQPADARAAFCTPTCRQVHFRHRCLVCEQPVQNARRSICGNPKCRREYRKFPHLYRADGQSPARCKVDAKSAHKTGTFLRPRSGRPWPQIAGPALSPRSFSLATLPLDPALADRIRRANLKVRNDAALIGPENAPITLVGDRFPSARRLNREFQLAILAAEQPSAQAELMIEPPGALLVGNDPGPIPKCLRRVAP
jgi:hypothetical protein